MASEDEIVKQWVCLPGSSIWHEVNPVAGIEGAAKTLCGVTIDRSQSTMQEEVRCPGVDVCNLCQQVRRKAAAEVGTANT